MFVGFNVEVECESLVKNCEDGEVRDWLVSGQPAKGHMGSTCLETEQSYARLVFASHFATWPSRE